MSVIMKNAFRGSLIASAKNILTPVLNIDSVKTKYARNLWHMSSQLNKMQNMNPLNNLSSKCSCGCGFSGAHTTDVTCQNEASKMALKLTQGEKELAEFLTEEISNEKKLQKQKKIPLELNGFTIKLDGSEVLMRKLDGEESVEISFNINHSVDSEMDPEIEPSADKPETGEMKSKPNFEVEIKKGGKTVGFTCSIVGAQAPQQSQEYNDLFMIDEIALYDGEWKDTNYSVAGEVIDGTLYDLLMNFLEDKGVSNELVEKIIDLSTAYEHSCYIDLLENLQKFSLGK